MNLDSVAEKLQDDGVGKMGKSIFINHMPADAVIGVLLRPPYVGTPIDYELPGYRKTKFNAIARAKDYKTAKELAAKVMESLTIAEMSISGMYVRHIRPKTEPVSFPISDGALTEFLMIFEAVYVIVD